VSCAVWRNIKSLNMVSIEFHEDVQLDQKSSVSRHSQRYMKIWRDRVGVGGVDRKEGRRREYVQDPTGACGRCLMSGATQLMSHFTTISVESMAYGISASNVSSSTRVPS
jgi:hypothetical protein